MAIKRWNANTSTWELVGTPGTVTPASIGSPSLSGTNVFTGQNGFGLAPVGANRVTIGGTSFTLDLHRYTSGGSVPGIELKKSLSDTVGSHVAITSSSPIGRITAMGSDGANFVGSSEINFSADGTVSTGIIPGKITISTVNSSGASLERMRIDSSGNVFVGTTSGAGRLRVSQSGQTSTVHFENTNSSWATDVVTAYSPGGVETSVLGISARSNGSTWLSSPYGAMIFRTGTSNSAADRLVLEANGNLSLYNAKSMLFYNPINTGAGSIYCAGGGSLTMASYGQPMITLHEDSEIRFFVGTGTQRAVINNAGELLIGYTSDNGAYRLQVNSQIFATSSTIATSDGRYKENISTIESGLNIIDSLRPVSFTWKDHPKHNFVAGKTVGFIAQEVKEALSEYDWIDNIIKTNISAAVLDEEGNEVHPEEEFLGIAEGNLIPLLVAAVKELRAEVNTLKAQVSN